MIYWRTDAKMLFVFLLYKDHFKYICGENIFLHERITLHIHNVQISF